MWQLAILMWKHMVVRKETILNSFGETVVPVIGFLFLFQNKSNFKPDGLPKCVNPMPAGESPLSNTHVIELAEFRPPPHWIAFYPETNLTNTLMDEVGPKLGLKRLHSYPVHSERGYFPYSNASGLPDISADMQIMEVIIIFQDMFRETWPGHLNYTIRMKGDFGMESYDSNQLIALSTRDASPRMNGLKYGTFMRVQWAVDTSYIKFLTGNDIHQFLSLQELPLLSIKSREYYMMLIEEYLCMITWLSLILTFTLVMDRLADERNSGVQELLQMAGVSLNKQRLSHLLNVYPIGVIYAIVGSIILIKSGGVPFVEFSEIYFILVLFLLYFNFIVCFASCCSFLLTDSQYATSLSVLLYILASVPARFIVDEEIPSWAHWLTGWLPNMPMYWFWKELFENELNCTGSNSSNITKSHTPFSNSILMSYIYLVLQSVGCQFLAWYLSYVKPGKLGQALPWNFIFKAEYWTKPKETKTITDEKDPVNPQYFETGPPNSVIGIKTINVSKMYPKHQALKNVNLNVYKGEITVLLGHNGAGKTTLISIITGMTSATEGQVLVNGMDTVLQKKEARKHLGLCAQHDMFFDSMNVQQHILLFTLLKSDNMTIREAEQSATELATKLGLQSSANALIKQLSGGMKRRVQLAIALAGGADILVLDEPTSGLDVETRRDLWDLLLSLRGERTVLLTTHYMEEADALGNRIAAIQDGMLRGFATPMYLKNAVGSGYRLSILTVSAPQEQAITRVLTSVIPGAYLKITTVNSLTYCLPTETNKFPDMFAALEAHRSELGIDSIGVGVATLEEVFITLCSNIDTTLTEEEIDDTLNQPEAPSERLTGIFLCMRQFCVLFKRQIRYTMFKKISFLLLQLFFPMALCAQVTLFTNTKAKDDANVSKSMNLDIYQDRADSRVLYHLDGPDVTLEDMDKARRRFPKVNFENTKDVATALLRTGEKDMYKYNNYLVGLEINETDAKVLYTTIVRHAAPVGLNLLSNMLASHYIPWSDGKTITTMNEPLNPKHKIATPPKDTIKAILWNLFVQLIILATTINSISLPSKELMTGRRHIHVMSGCPPVLHWTVSMLYHSMICVLTTIVPLTVMALLIEKDDTINQPDFLMVYMLVTQVGSMAFVAFGYIISQNFTQNNTHVILITSVAVFGVITSGAKMQQLYLSGSGKSSRFSFGYYSLWIFNIIAVPHTLVITTTACATDAVVNANCNAYKQFCPLINITDDISDTVKCCAGERPRNYLEIKSEGTGIGLIILIAQFLVLMTIVVLFEIGIFRGLVEYPIAVYRIAKCYCEEGPELNETVQAEKEYIEKTIKLPANQIPDSLLVHNIHKMYHSWLTSRYACKGVNFSVKKGECFGLLGVNGAGKTTVFKMLTNEQSFNEGDLFINGYHWRRGDTRYLKTLGYCPQFFGLDLFLTGEANLEVILALRGFASTRIKHEIDTWIRLVGMEMYARQVTNGYSGGCLRRIGAAAALCGDAKLSLLDEPSAGVDVIARRRLWTAMRKAMRRGRSIVITSHSMDEMEVLCNRIAIMARGRVRALGAPAELRAKHAKGFAVMIKLSHAFKLEGEDHQILAKFKDHLHEILKCTLKDEHMTMLHYHIDEVLPLSNLFNTFESLRREYPTVVEDYTISETTLEEVFLHYATEKPIVKDEL